MPLLAFTFDRTYSIFLHGTNDAEVLRLSEGQGILVDLKETSSAE